MSSRFTKFPSGLRNAAIASMVLAGALSGCDKPPALYLADRTGVASDDDLEGGKGNVGTSDPSQPPDPNSPSDPVDVPSTGEDPDGSTPPIKEDPIEPVDPNRPEPMEPDPKDPMPEDPNPLTECAGKLSVGRIHQWHATNEGIMIPSSGLIVVKEGGQNLAKVEFVGEGWHVVPVWLKNAYEAEADLSKSKNFILRYRATADLYVQLRPSFAWSGGDKWAAKIPSTGGEMKTLTVSFEDASQWTAPLGPVPHTLNEARARARGFVFIGNKPTKFAVSSLVIDGYTPPCD